MIVAARTSCRVTWQLAWFRAKLLLFDLVFVPSPPRKGMVVYGHSLTWREGYKWERPCSEPSQLSTNLSKLLATTDVARQVDAITLMNLKSHIMVSLAVIQHIPLRIVCCCCCFWWASLQFSEFMARSELNTSGAKLRAQPVCVSTAPYCSLTCHYMVLVRSLQVLNLL